MNNRFTSGAKEFKDPVYGYIALPSAYADFLIDTQQLQRIKGVAQTGIRSVFAAASHDRFCHSLGVYKFGNEIYASLSSRLKELLASLVDRSIFDEAFKNKIEAKLPRWKALLNIACLIHDIGHPVQSHGFEFLFDDFYLDCASNKTQLILQSKIPEEEKTRISHKHEQFVDSIVCGNGILRGDLSKEIIENIKKKDKALRKSSNDPSVFDIEYEKLTLPGNPHERMSVFYLWTDQNLQQNIRELIKSSFPDLDDSEFFQDLLFISRMIIGWEYEVSPSFSFDEHNFENSIRNCIIHILNGKIDADGMDYLMRNSYSAGYDTSKVDYDRLCGAYSVYEKDNLVYSAFSKSALSALEGYISARNFEPKWLYSHHKVVYSDLLTKQLYKYVVKYLAEKTVFIDSINMFLSHTEYSALRGNKTSNDLPEGFLLAKNGDAVHYTGSVLSAHMQHWIYPFYTYILAPIRSTKIGEHNYHRMVDADFDALLHSMQQEIQDGKYCEYRKNLIDKAKDHFRKFQLSDIDLRTLIAEICLFEQPSQKQKEEIIISEETKQYAQAWIANGSSETLEQLKQACNGSDVRWELFEAPLAQEKILEIWLESYNSLLSENEYNDFYSLLCEYRTRKYKTSLWKSYAEYRLFIQDCAHELGLSYNRIHKYMRTMITEGMDVKGFSIFDGKNSISPPATYVEQFYYVPMEIFYKGSDLFQSADSVFTMHPNEYDFSHGNVVVKFYKMKYKKFDDLNLMFRDRVVNVADVLDLTAPESVEYPYFFYKQSTATNANKEKVLSSFKRDFIECCRKMHQKEIVTSSSATTNSYVFRDSVHGDITLSEKFYEVVCTKEFQRLRRIKQLATAEQAFPSATHTRFAHSLGTWFVMTKILDHLEKQFENIPVEMRPTSQEKDALLLAALLHDIGHGPYSHAFEELIGTKWNHEKQTVRILEDKDSDIHRKIDSIFGTHTLQMVIELLNEELAEDNSSMMKVIYHSLLSSQLDADRIDYIMRDNIACGMAYGHIDMQQIIASMSLTILYNDGIPSFRLCFDNRYLSAIDQFIYARYQMYKNVYHEPRKLLYEKVFLQILKKAYSLHELLIYSSVTKIIFKLCEHKRISASDFLLLDDEAIDSQIRDWATGRILKEKTSLQASNIADQIQMLSRAFLGYDTIFERIDLGAKILPYNQLAKKMAHELGMPEASKMTQLAKELSAIFYIESDSYAYSSEDQDCKSILIKNHADGILSDYFSCSMFAQASGGANQKLWESRYCCLFFSKKLMWKECEMRNLDDAENMYNRVIDIVEKSKPRTHIEIEKKYICTNETLCHAQKHLKTYCEKENSRYTIDRDDQEEQVDTYFDIIVNGEPLLYTNGFSFRIRAKRDNDFVFTVKGAVKSKNYASNQQVARYEHEKRASSANIDDNAIEFLSDALAACGADELIEEIKSGSLNKVLIIKNDRRTVQLKDKLLNRNVCEVCFDKVIYQDASSIAIDYLEQIEIELLDQPEYWYTLSALLITPFEVEMKAAGLCMETNKKSKLAIGLERLGLQSETREFS